MEVTRRLCIMDSGVGVTAESEALVLELSEPLSHWIVCTAEAEPSEPSVLTQIHRQEFPLARTENRQRLLFNAWGKGVVGCIPAPRRENGAAELTLE